MKTFTKNDLKQKAQMGFLSSVFCKELIAQLLIDNP